MDGTETCEICGKPDANVAYFCTGMTEVVYRHYECDRRHYPRELSPQEERQEWGLYQQELSRPEERQEDPRRRQCQHCSKSFRSKRNDTRFRTNACRQSAYRERQVHYVVGCVGAVGGRKWPNSPGTRLITCPDAEELTGIYRPENAGR